MRTIPLYERPILCAKRAVLYAKLYRRIPSMTIGGAFSSWLYYCKEIALYRSKTENRIFQLKKRLIENHGDEAWDL